jgi:two-component system heavy metal sensor histidine kinase CusS
VSRLPTLRARLTVSVVAVLAVVLLSFSLLLQAAFGRALWAALDDRLRSEARALAGMVEQEPDGHLELEFEGVSALPDFDDRPRPAYFQVWRPDRQPLARSPSLRGQDLPEPGQGMTVSRRILPDGRPGRFLLARLPGTFPPGPFLITVARGTEHEDAALARLRHLLWGLGGLALVVAAGAAALTVSRSLRPAATLAGAIGAIDPRDLGRRVVVPDLPRELAPAVAKLNELLARLDESFARERRFTADVSHELRTPLAGLRTMLEVAASRARSPAEYRAVVNEAGGIVRQMHALTEDLLMLARLDADEGQGRDGSTRAPARDAIPLRRFVDECWQPFAARAARRGLTFVNGVGEEAALSADRDKLRLVVRNLLSNAAAYTEPGGRVTVEAGTGEVVLDVCDSGPPIPEELLPRLFERFFRADQSRSGGGDHAGIGLALVEALCVPLGLRVTAENLPGGSVRFRLRRAPVRVDSPPS